MNEFERKLYLKYRHIGPFFKPTAGLHKKNLSNQLSNFKATRVLDKILS